MSLNDALDFILTFSTFSHMVTWWGQCFAKTLIGLDFGLIYELRRVSQTSHVILRVIKLIFRSNIELGRPFG